MNPLYITQSSSGPGKWNGVDTTLTPQQLSWYLTLASSATQTVTIEATLDLPFSFGGAAGQREGGVAVNPSSSPPYVFAICGSSSGVANGVYQSSIAPITAWRLNCSSNTGVTATFLQSGIVG